MNLVTQPESPGLIGNKKHGHTIDLVVFDVRISQRDILSCKQAVFVVGRAVKATQLTVSRLCPILKNL